MRDVLCAPRSDSRAAGACTLSNAADQQAAVVWSTFAGIIRRLGFIFVRSHRNTGVAGGELEGIHQRNRDVSDVKRLLRSAIYSCFFFLSSFAI